MLSLYATQHINIPVVSRTTWYNFRDFQGLKRFSRTLQGLEIWGKIQNSQEGKKTNNSSVPMLTHRTPAKHAVSTAAIRSVMCQNNLLVLHILHDRTADTREVEALAVPML